MLDDLRQQLIEINRDFYRRSWRQFMARRERPWPGWARLLEELDSETLPENARVLDLGCGHGRFAGFLAERSRRVRYLGVDTSLPLLAQAATTFREPQRVWLCGDLLSALAAGTRFDLVVAFGLLHHVPGFDARARLVSELAGRTDDGGALVVTLWSPDRRRRQRATAVEGGEPGDVLLPWGEGESSRYCHFFDDDEVTALANAAAAAVNGTVTGFRADGRKGENHYLIARAPARPSGWEL